MTDAPYEPHADASRSMFRAALTRLGLGLDGPGFDSAAAAFGAALRIDPVAGCFALDEAGNRRVTIRDGRAEDAGPAGVEDLIRELAMKHGTKAPSAPAPASTTPNLTESMQRTRANESKALADAITGNPWRKDSFNLTEQMTLSRHDPARAARLKAQAGVRS